MKWLSFVNGIIGIILILIAVSGLIANHMAAGAVAIGGLVVLALAAIRWITGFGRLSRTATRPELSH